MKRSLPKDEANASEASNCNESAGAKLLDFCLAGDEASARVLLETEAANDDGDSADVAAYQDDSNGMSCLMAAAGKGSLALVKLLLQHGAPWNALDRQSRCAGEYAVAGIDTTDSTTTTTGEHQACVDCLVQAGVAAELLFGAVDRQERLAKAEANSSPTPGEDKAISASVDASTNGKGSTNAADGGDGTRERGDGSSSASSSSAAPAYDAHHPAPPGLYLEDRGVRYDGDNLLDSADDAVMMAWEAPLMEAHADVLCATGLEAFGSLLDPLGVDIATSVCAHASSSSGSSSSSPGTNSSSAEAEGRSGRAVLNIGFGMGIVDNALQRRKPGRHVIVEAHPAVYARMVEDGWLDKPGVEVVFGKWQDVNLASLGPFHGVFFDTYGERYSDMSDFHSALPSMLHPGGVYSFFNGMCPFNVFFHGVACELVDTELKALAFKTVFVPLHIELDPETWEGVTRKYWQRDTYYLPISVYLPS